MEEERKGREEAKRRNRLERSVVEFVAVKWQREAHYRGLTFGEVAVQSKNAAR